MCWCPPFSVQGCKFLLSRQPSRDCSSSRSLENPLLLDRLGLQRPASAPSPGPHYGGRAAAAAATADGTVPSLCRFFRSSVYFSRHHEARPRRLQPTPPWYHRLLLRLLFPSRPKLAALICIQGVLGKRPAGREAGRLGKTASFRRSCRRPKSDGDA